MKLLKAAAATIALLAIGPLGAVAQDNSAANPDSSTMSPSTTVPSGEGASSGEEGANSPAGIPADPNTDQNVQPGPSTNTPNDPAAGSNPGARAPTSPPGTGSSTSP